MTSYMKMPAAIALAAVMGICAACGSAEDQAEMEAPARPGELSPGYEQPGYGQPDQPIQPGSPEGIPMEQQPRAGPFDVGPPEQDAQDAPRVP